MNNFNLTIKSGSGKFSKLDKLYRDFAINSINNSEEEYLDRWEVYNVIMNELIKIGVETTTTWINARSVSEKKESSPSSSGLNTLEPACLSGHTDVLSGNPLCSSPPPPQDPHPDLPSRPSRIARRWSL